MQYRLSVQALADLKEAAAYSLEMFGDQQTRVYMTGLYYAFDRLVFMPRMGQEWDKAKDIYRFYYKAHTVYYRILRDGTVGILRVYGSAKRQPKISDISNRSSELE